MVFIMNVMFSLAGAGDNPSIKREVEHFIYFKNTFDMDSFANDIFELGYPFEPAIHQPGLLVKTKLSLANGIDICLVTLKMQQ